MIFDEHDLAGAVYMFSEDMEVIREMNFAEFQAVVDGYAPAVDLANRSLHAVFVEINCHYHIRNAVFFNVRFTSEGFVDSNYALPLFELSQNTMPGPDLGSGPIGLACSSHCALKSMAPMLWQPDLSEKLSELRILADVVVRNRIAIHFSDTSNSSGIRMEREPDISRQVMERSISESLRKEYDKELREQLTKAFQEQHLRDAEAVKMREGALSEMRQRYDSRIDEYQMRLSELQKRLQEERDRNAMLTETIDGQAKKIEGLREYFALKLEQMEAPESDGISANYEEDLKMAVEDATSELKDLLQMREVEILYRNEQENKLNEDLDDLRAQNKALMSNSGDVLLSRMLENGISFVTFQPGAGHITLPVGEISRYMENPVAYVAERCDVSEAHYNAWLEHYHVPICQTTNDSGEFCGENISRVESPADFVVGESDCCHKHRKSKKPRLKLAGS
ncbi:hypothetical protein [Agarilytica rhodophyticola]|uniref:hypothetical protein n=1 Tax=Agarilytica rhodophyticola TaxID=1737490 RepID=UPI000B345C1D|nr:hypothetical protein [Agarilytica rhodophyticola]